MPENKKIRIRPKADKDLEYIYEYSYQEFGGARADQYMRDLDTAFHKLADEPSLGSDYSHVRPDHMAYRIVSYVVFFKSSVDGIIILGCSTNRWIMDDIFKDSPVIVTTQIQ